ncbi:Cell division protein DivIB [Jeotgalicoccus saudimassiliensis]|uniref:Cell division protein DivIB n=1 Tax=Jeotgalicoccus saudimassiliensis TaxID=1461582 RepID=A0A078M3X2_9STAP|nr:FtsQ-type POTRA domain-containing protein [Jeotgalicoccus saudimassiliensis]CDZ99416.1 Cell division protein DivIB [Jeotgalicoccus saudimassiliensis]
MNKDQENIDDIKEKLKKKRQDTEYVGYTAKTPEQKDSGQKELHQDVKKTADSKPVNDKKNNAVKKDTPARKRTDKKTSGKSDDKPGVKAKKEPTPHDELALKIEHYKDFEAQDSGDSKENKTVTGKKEKASGKKKWGNKTASENDRKGKPLKQKEKFEFKRIHMYIGIVVFLVLLLAALLWYVFTSASDVKEIKFEGNSLVTEAELEERIGFSKGDKMFSISAGKAEENVELLPVIEEVSVERDWPNSVTVNVNEYKAIAYINSEDLYFPVLENSRIQRGYPSAPRNAPIIYNFEGEEFDALVAALNEIEVDILESISEIYFRPTDNSMRRIHVFMNDGQEIVADYETFSDKMNYYIGIRQEIGDDTGGIIDMEVGTSYLPYDSADAREIKDNIYNEPSQVGYIEDINVALDGVRSALGEIDSASDE